MDFKTSLLILKNKKCDKYNLILILIGKSIKIINNKFV